MLTIQTERMKLIALDREQLTWCMKDAGHLAEALQVHIAPDVFSEESRQAMGIKTTRMLLVDSKLHPWYTYFLLVRKEDQVVMGVCGFKGAPTPYGAVELGYGIHENYRRQGYMTEAVLALIDWAFEHEECVRVTAETLRDNYPSQRVLIKAGLTLDHSAESMLYWKLDRPT